MSQINRPNPFDPPRVPEPPDPNERLTQLQIELKQNQDRQSDLGKQATELQTDITDLQQGVGDVKATVTSYGGQVKTFETDLHSLQYFYEQKHKMIIAAIGDKKGPIDDLIREFDYETSRMEECLAELTEKLTAAQQESQRAATVQNGKQNEYNAVKAYPQNTQTQLGDLDTLRTSITQDDTATDVASMYFHVLEFQHELGATHIWPQHQLALELKQKLGELEQAKEQARIKNAEANRLQTECNTQQATLSARQTGRRQTLLGLIQAMYPVPAPQPSSTASTTTTTAGTPVTPATAVSPSTQTK
jgi:peptidoglycan hydrolase CwlO-like protein